uniref:Uncharacterized protein n=1 Tax=virus sp. ctoC338 TaxID=2827997 RepID=A0A8S5SWU7_9VIRU|nr:MAG TPA: hypothetical protein [virus sp. ctoC338]DAG32579.1 MAG TPA: hypothetical protein [Caudoviricetes sp.]
MWLCQYNYLRLHCLFTLSSLFNRGGNTPLLFF